MPAFIFSAVFQMWRSPPDVNFRNSQKLFWITENYSPTVIICCQTDKLPYLYQCEVGVCTYNLAVTKILEQNLELVQKILGGGDETLSALSQHSWHTSHPHQPHVACNEYQLGNDCDGRSDSAWMSVITDHNNDKIIVISLGKCSAVMNAILLHIL